MRRLALVLLVAAAFTVAAASVASAQPAEPAEPDTVAEFGVNVDSESDGVGQTVTLILLLTVGAVAPSILLMMTAFVRFAVVFGIAKQALALQTVPPPQVLVGLALFLTAFVMAPVFEVVYSDAFVPLLDGQMDVTEALSAAYDPMRQFMLAQTRPEDLQLFAGMAGLDGAAAAEIPAQVLVPAFVISELRTAFIIGFIVFLPFLILDLVVAASLMSLGMVMLPPVFISLPLKLLLFILVDGWHLLVGSMVRSVEMVDVAARAGGLA